MSGFERWSKARRARIAFDDIAKDWLIRAGADIPTSRKVDAPPTSSSACRPWEKNPKSSVIRNSLPKLGRVHGRRGPYTPPPCLSGKKETAPPSSRGPPRTRNTPFTEVMSGRGLLLYGRGVREGLAPGDLRGIRQVFGQVFSTHCIAARTDSSAPGLFLKTLTLVTTASPVLMA